MNILKRIPENLQGRDFVVGDLHGEYDKLMSQLDSLDFDSRVDRLLAVGDLGDRGTKSYECANLTMHPWFYSVRGNHEQMFVDAVIHQKQEAITLLLSVGGAWAYEISADARDEISRRYAKLPYALEVPRKGSKFGIVHADVTFNNWKSIDITEREAKYSGSFFIPSLVEQLMWGNVRITTGLREVVHNIDHIFVGHVPIFNRDVTLGNVSYLDTGSVWDEARPLKIINLDDYITE